MKKIIFPSLGFIIIAIATASSVAAQSFYKGIAFSAFKNYPALAAYADESASPDKSALSSTSPDLTEKGVKESKAKLRAIKANVRAPRILKRLLKIHLKQHGQFRKM